MTKAEMGIWVLSAFAASGIAPALAQTASETVLHSFGRPPLNGANPWAGVIRDPAGNLYGTTYEGGPWNKGIVYKLDLTGRQTVLYRFTGGADGGQPYAGVILDSAGNLYGTTSLGGAADAGVVYKLDATGHETVLYSFTGGADGTFATSGVIRDLAGNLYGTTEGGGKANLGVVYKVDATGRETVLHSFTGGADGSYPFAGVIRDSAGNLYGTTINGGPGNVGVVYKLDIAGHETVLYTFTGGSDGGRPEAGVILDPEGNLYGTTEYGGIANAGVVYKVDVTGQETVLYRFTKSDLHRGNPAGVIRDSAGNLYGTVFFGGARGNGIVYKLDTAGQETVLYSFMGKGDGDQPVSGLIRDSEGNLYGTTYRGGAAGRGVVYKLDTTGVETVLYSFPGDADGLHPHGGVVRDSAGNLYGTTNAGGPGGLGTVFKLTATGQETVLHSFGGGADGNGPYAGVIRDSAGNLYGTTYYGGAGRAGVVFKLDASGQETVLYSFTGGADGGYPIAGVIRDAAGNLYGTTYFGGALNSGVAFKLDTSGRETVLHNFTGGADGGYPDAGVILDSSGNLYGTTDLGGALNSGVVYKLDATGHETVLHTFTGGADGGQPYAGVILDSGGNLYGTAGLGGAANEGVVYKLDAAGRETVLYNFTNGADGALPSAGVILDPAGNLYGTASTGAFDGVAFKLDPSGQYTVLYTFRDGVDGGNPSAGGMILDPAGNLYGATPNGGQRNGGVVFKLTLQ